MFFLGFEWLFGNLCNKFVFEEQNEEETTKYTMWVRYLEQPATRRTTSQPIPVRFEMQKSHTTRGSNYDKFHIDYKSFKTYLSEEELENVFKIDQGKHC